MHYSRSNRKSGPVIGYTQKLRVSHGHYSGGPKVARPTYFLKDNLEKEMYMTSFIPGRLRGKHENGEERHFTGFRGLGDGYELRVG